ncbi:hypothetical protein HY932_02270, partial [Candidatus Falkowbacteria bacterium]|nr:hypothetical protein [Candidatus Falkowbacteria bacterium]
MGFVQNYYQKKYHLQFVHAKKLFVFDITMLLSIIFLIILTVFWFTYNPFISDQISLTITPSTDKIRSGDYITYVIEIQNNSDTKLISPKLVARLPVGFILDKASPAETFSAVESSFALKNLPEKNNQTVAINGWTFGVPNAEERLTVELSYQQEKRGIRETKTASLLQIHRGSILNLALDAPNKLIAQGAQPITLTIKNNDNKKIDKIKVPLAIGQGLNLINTAPNNGEIKDNVWLIADLKPDAEAVLKALLNSSFSDTATKTTISLTPSIVINGTDIKQETLEKTLEITHPKLNTFLTWDTEKNYVEPGEILILKTKIENIGDIDLQNLGLEIPISSNIIDIGRLTKQNYASYKNQKLTINKNFVAGLANLPAQKTIDLTISIPISYAPQGGEDVTLSLNPKISGIVKNTDSTYQIETQTNRIKIGTALNLDAEARYYTNDGDQLGRGPLPPRIGKETKYWALFKITNTTSNVTNVKLTATLPDYVRWTGKTSVSEGNAIQYDEINKAISWSVSKFLPHSDAGIY